MQENIHITVAAIIENDNRFLLVEELVHGQTVYNQPAGHLEDNETLIAASIRETLEESAWQFVPEYITGIYQWSPPENEQTFLRFCFAGQHQQHDKERQLDSGIIRAVWLDRQEIISRQDQLRSPLVLTCIDDYLKGQRYPLELLQHVI